ncbi:putative spermidine/putrescine transporter subunit [Escherichia coli]|uniref:Putative spermidine/putrescine transporter subunit n=1 Tax=Escherichia coli TaxID=562 RepID=A0A377CV40_ECOLX|nr:putative spermidine/putrescine transporter subunit [Escherichia coli]
MGKRVQPINTALIPNWKTLDPRVVKGDWFNVGGKVYGTPYQWGPNLLMYNTKTFRRRRIAGKWFLLSKICRTARAIKAAFRLMMALSTLRTLRCSLKPLSRSWGISDPYQLTEEQYQAGAESAARSTQFDPSLLA